MCPVSGSRVSCVYFIICALFTDWFKVLRVGVFPCSTQGHSVVCRRYDATSYPTLKVGHNNVVRLNVVTSEIYYDFA